MLDSRPSIKTPERFLARVIDVTVRARCLLVCCFMLSVEAQNRLKWCFYSTLSELVLI